MEEVADKLTGMGFWIIYLKKSFPSIWKVWSQPNWRDVTNKLVIQCISHVMYFSFELLGTRCIFSNCLHKHNCALIKIE